MPTDHGSDWARNAFADARRVLDAFMAEPANLERVDAVAGLLADAFRAGQKAMICGNGGSSADAMHFAEELTGRFRKERPPLPALACTDPGHITCTANDYGYDHVFARWVTALGKAGDVLLVLSTSGNSRNIVEAARAGRARGMVTVALLGKDGGALRGACDHEWIVRDPAAPGGGAADRVQEVHMLVLHALIEGVERRLFPENYR
jgi:D-sedoheptulose 7-phosphate isomerase